MDRVSVILLLLFCSLSVAELQGNEILEQRRASAEQPQPCPSDLHAVLRDITAKLATLTTKMEHLEKENQEQAVMIKELQKENQEQAVTIKELQKENLVQSTKLTVVDSLEQQLKGQAAELNRIKTRTNVTETHVESLRRDRAVGRVAFSVSLWESGLGWVGPVSADTTLVFSQVFSNFGNAYNSNTGVFTAPVRGVYHFEYYIFQHTPHAAKVALVKNGENIVNAYEYQSSSHGTTANGATLLLEAGDVVFLRLRSSYKIYDSPEHYSTFSGRLLFPV